MGSQVQRDARAADRTHGVFVDTFGTGRFGATLESAGIKPVRLPPRSPNLNAYMERFLRSLKSEYLDRMIFFGEYSLRNAVREYLARYHGEHNHQGLGN